MRKLFWLLLLWQAAVFTVAQTGDTQQGVTLSQLDTAVAQVTADTQLADTDRSELLDSYQRTREYIKNTQGFKEKTQSYKNARTDAIPEAEKLKASLEKRSAKVTDEKVTPDPALGIADIDQQVQRDKAELAALDTRLSEVNDRLQLEVERPIAVRERLTELQTQQSDVDSQLKMLPQVSESSRADTAKRWLLEAQNAMNKAEMAMLEEELLSQPMRLELLKAQQDSGSFDKSRLDERIKSYELYAIELHQGAAEQAATEARTAAEEAEGKHPLIQQLADSNTELSDRSTKVAGALNSVKEQEAIATAQAERFETDLKAVMQKMQIIGMSQALGQILREQRARLPVSHFSARDAGNREQQIAESSLRQLEYEEERHQLRSASAYVDQLVAGLPEEEASGIRENLVTLAKARRELIKRSLEVESAYLRSLGDLDFAIRRLQTAAEAYGEFIARRLLWIRTTDPLSLNTFADLPQELADILDPAGWWSLLKGVATQLLESPAYLLIFLPVAVLVQTRGRVRRLLRATAEHLGNYRKDRFSHTVFALFYSALLAIVWPLTMWVVGWIIFQSNEELPLANAVGAGLMRLSHFYLGIEFVRQVLRPGGLANSHFNWSTDRCRAMSLHLRSLQRTFLPLLFAGIIPARMHVIDGGSVLSMIFLIIALAALARFFYLMPKGMRGSLDDLLRAGRRSERAPLWGQLTRWVLIAIPCALILCMLLGYGNTAISFLALLLYTIALIAGLLILQEMGVRWLRVIRRRMVAAERAQERAAEDDRPADEIFEEDFGELETETLDDEGRKLLAGVLSMTAIVGVIAIWSDVLPALGILDSVQLWSRNSMIDGQDTLVPVTLADIGIALLVALAGALLVRRVPKVLEILLRQKLAVSHGSVYAATTLFRYMLVAVIVIVVLDYLGASWSQIQWAVAALSVGIGFGLQEIVANFISGLILLFEQPIRVGDTVTVGETSGVVTRIRMRATTIRDWDRRELLVPNKEFITGRLLNWSLSDQLSRFAVEIGVAYGSDLRKAMEVALEVARKHPDVMNDPEPFITFDEFGDNSLKLVLRCFLDNVDRRLTISSRVRLELERRFKEEGIVIAFPQRDIHLDSSAPLDINIRRQDPQGDPA